MTFASETVAYVGPAFLVSCCGRTSRKFTAMRILRRVEVSTWDAWIPVRKPIGLPEPTSVRHATVRFVDEDSIVKEVCTFEVRFEDQRREIAVLYGLDPADVLCRYVFLVDP